MRRMDTPLRCLRRRMLLYRLLPETNTYRAESDRFIAIGFDLPQSDQIEIEMEGQWEKSSHGLQYQVEKFHGDRAAHEGGILGYLSCGSVKGVGAKVAEAIYKEFGLNTLEIMEEHPQELLKVKGISKKKLKGIVESYGKNKVFRNS